MIGAMGSQPPVMRAVVVDVDGVVSAVAPEQALPWGDEVEAGTVFGPVLVSPALCDRLDALAEILGVSCWWLTSWTAQMRARMNPLPGAHWPGNRGTRLIHCLRGQRLVEACRSRGLAGTREGAEAGLV